MGSMLYARHARIDVKRIRVATFQPFGSRHELKGLLRDVKLAGQEDDMVRAVAGEDVEDAIQAPRFLESRHVIHVANFERMPGFRLTRSQELRSTLESDSVISELMAGYRGATVTARRYNDASEVGIICLNSMFICLFNV
jgi:hypothetical protein